MQKTKKEMKKRVVTLVDQSQAEVGLTLWGATAINFDPPETHPVIALKGAKVTDFGGVSLAAWSSTVIEVKMLTFVFVEELLSLKFSLIILILNQ